MAFISQNWIDACNNGAVFGINGRIDYYSTAHAPTPIQQDKFYYDSISFTNDHLLENSLHFSVASNQDGALTAGGLAVSSVSLTLINYDNTLDFSGYAAQPYKGRLCLQIYCNNLSGQRMYVNMPTFYITSLRNNHGLVMIEAIDAFDCMNTRPDPSIASTNILASSFLTNICAACKPSPGGAEHQSGVESILPPNITTAMDDFYTSTQYVDFSNTTYAEMLRKFGERVGLVMRFEPKSANAALSGDPPNQQISGWGSSSITISANAVVDAEITDEYYIGKVRAYDYADASVYGDSIFQNVGRNISISGNPFVYGTSTQLGTIANLINSMVLFYTPSPTCSFRVTALCNPAITPLDQVTFTYHGTTYTGVVHSVEWTLGGYMTLSCYWQEQEDITTITPEAIGAWSAASLPMTPTISASIGTAGTSCAAGATITQGSVTFEPGTYLILVNAFFSSNANGIRIMYFSETSSGSAIDGSVYDARPAVDGAAARLKFQTIKTFETSTTLYLRARQTSTSTLTFTAEYSSIKIF